MKATGIVRKIDDLGRVVIPKEIRRSMRIREGSPLEIFTNKNGGIILKKFSPIKELGTIVKECADSLAQASGHTTFVVDRDQIIAVSAGAVGREFLEKNISSELETVISVHSNIIEDRSGPKFVRILEDDSDSEFNHEVIVTILSEGDALGAVILLSRDQKLGDAELKLAQTKAGFLGKQV